MRTTCVAACSKYALGMLGLLLIGVVGVAADLYASLRRLVPAASYNPKAAPIDRCEIR
jgi:hypothetical protein